MNIVYIGEAGSGKTELALNTAQTLSKSVEKAIVLIDIDQTKALFRLREKAGEVAGGSLEVKWGKQLLDAPITPAGVKEAISDSERICIIDVGGNAVGAVQLGQFSDALAESETEIYYCINPYRPFTGADELSRRIVKIRQAARIQNIKILCNPNLGDNTSPEDVLTGIMLMENTLAEIGFSIDTVAALDEYYEKLSPQIQYPIIRLKRYITM